MNHNLAITWNTAQSGGHPGHLVLEKCRTGKGVMLPGARSLPWFSHVQVRIQLGMDESAIRSGWTNQCINHSFRCFLGVLPSLAWLGPVWCCLRSGRGTVELPLASLPTSPLGTSRPVPSKPCDHEPAWLLLLLQLHQPSEPNVRRSLF